MNIFYIIAIAFLSGTIMKTYAGDAFGRLGMGVGEFFTTPEMSQMQASSTLRVDGPIAVRV